MISGVTYQSGRKSWQKGIADNFNCSEEHEFNQVNGKYRDREKADAFIREKCRDKTIHYWTHDKLGVYLAESGFQPVKAITQAEFISGISVRFVDKVQVQAAFKEEIDGNASVLKFGKGLSLKVFGTGLKRELRETGAIL